jgi:hypothetical protein
MNKRIKELAKELGPVATIGNWGRVEWADNVYPQFGDKMYAAVDLEKFAELIVRECADIVADAVDHREPASTYVEKIKQHFGVEE